MRRGELAVNLILLSPVLIAIFLVCLLLTPLNIGIVCLCYAFGVATLVKAKWSLFRRGVWITLGPSRLPPERRRAYWIGYAFIAVGVLLNLIVIAILARRHDLM